MIHPTAIIDPAARLAPDVKVGPFCVIDGPVQIGPGCELRSHAKIVGPLTMGARNVVHSFSFLGGAPQDLKYRDEPSTVVIGDDNVFREGVTVHRAVGAGSATTIGSRCFLMVNSHVGHNASLGDHAILINGALIGGHCQIGPRAIVGGNCALHQLCRVGRLAMISNATAYNVDFPPFMIGMRTNMFLQLNVVGMRRSGMPAANVNAMRKLFQHVYRTHRDKPVAAAFALLPPEISEMPEAQELMAFYRAAKRAVARFEPWSQRGKTAADNAD